MSGSAAQRRSDACISVHLHTSVSKGTGRMGAAALSAVFLNPGSPHCAKLAFVGNGSEKR